MRRSPWAGIVCLSAVLLCLWVVAHARYSTDLSAFLPSTPDVRQRLLVKLPLAALYELTLGVAAGLAGWVITVLSGQAADGRFTAAVTSSALVLPYLAFAACCAGLVLYATRIPRGSS